MKTIVLSPGAAKVLDKLPDEQRTRLADAPHAYAMTGEDDTKAMAGVSAIRLRAGDDRVIFDETETKITVLAIGHRREIYR